jgi:hypothetical protein
MSAGFARRLLSQDSLAHCCYQIHSLADLVGFIRCRHTCDSCPGCCRGFTGWMRSPDSLAEYARRIHSPDTHAGCARWMLSLDALVGCSSLSPNTLARCSHRIHSLVTQPRRSNIGVGYSIDDKSAVEPRRGATMTMITALLQKKWMVPLESQLWMETTM